MAPGKKQKLSSYGRNSFVSGRALSALMKEVKERGIPDADSRTSIYDARMQELDEETKFGKVIDIVDAVDDNGDPQEIALVNPFAFIQLAIKRCILFKAFLLNVFRQCGNRITIVLYSDEISPGQVLVARVPRKTQTIYWSLFEFGSYILSQEDAWFPLATVRSDDVATISAGMSQLAKLAMQQFFGVSEMESDLTDLTFVKVSSSSLDQRNTLELLASSVHS